MDRPQLVRLLERLSSEERDELLLLRGELGSAALTNRGLANDLSDPSSLSKAFINLNAFQLLLLGWLASQPDHVAPYSLLVQELAGGVDADYLAGELRDMRLWAVLDYEASSPSGFVGTFPAIVAALPSSRFSVRTYLERQGSEDVRQVCVRLGVKASNKKEERTRAILLKLGRPEVVAELVERLSENARRLLDWVRSRGGRVSVAELERRPEIGKLSGRLGFGIHFYGQVSDDEPLTELARSCLVVPRVPYPNAYHVEDYQVPVEIERALTQGSLFDSKMLRPPLLRRAEGVVGCFPDPSHLLRDVAHMLGFIASKRCEWRQDGEPYDRSLQVLGKAMGADRAYPKVLWSLCRSANLARSGYPKPGFTVAPLGEMGPTAMFDLLIDAWTKPLLDGIAGNVSTLEATRIRLLLLLQSIPADTWITQESLREHLAFQWPLLFGPRATGGPPPDALWDSIGYVVLGQGKTPQGGDAVMVPAVAQDLLSGAEGSAERLPPWDSACVVQADRGLVAPPNSHPESIIDLWRVADLESNHGAALFRLTRESVTRALNGGMAPKEVLALLKSRSKVPLPETVERLIADQGQRYGKIKVSAARTIVQVEDPALLEQLMHDRKLAGMGWRRLAPGVAAIDGKDALATLDALRLAGHLPVLANGAVSAESEKSVPRKPASVSRPRRRRGLTWRYESDDEEDDY